MGTESKKINNRGERLFNKEEEEMTISDKTVYRVITIIIFSMLVVSFATTGASVLTALLILGFIIALFLDDEASYEYFESHANEQI